VSRPRWVLLAVLGAVALLAVVALGLRPAGQRTTARTGLADSV